MSAEHMGMVFAAEGLDGSEKLLLLGYTNWTDPYGYCWPSEDRLVDDCGTSRSTVQRTKRKLIKKKLLKSVRRKNSRGEPISNLSRVNLPLLASMARAEKAYDDNLIDQITFDDDTQGDPEATLRGTPDNPEPPSDLLTHHFDSYPESNRLVPGVKMTHVGMSQNDSPSLSDPEGISLSGPGSPSGDGLEADGERRPATPKGATGEVPEQRTESAPEAPADRIARVWAEQRQAHGLSTSPSRVKAFAREASVLLAQGHATAFLESSARTMAEHPTWVSLTKQVDSVPATPAGAVRRPTGVGARVADPAEAAAIAAILARGSGL